VFVRPRITLIRYSTAKYNLEAVRKNCYQLFDDAEVCERTVGGNSMSNVVTCSGVIL
jgi:hypothetical protein